MNSKTLNPRQNQILVELSQIPMMKKGSITQQCMKIQHPSKGETVRGPYPLLTWKEAGQTRSLRLKTKEELAWAEQAISNYKRFAALCQEYEHLAELRAFDERQMPGSASLKAQKKTRKSPRSNPPK